MNKADMSQFVILMSIACELYKESISQRLMDFYWQMLSSFDFVDVDRAFKYHMSAPKERNFMPKPSDIAYLIKGDGKSRGPIAWSKVEKAIRYVGGYSSVVFDDAVIHAVIDDMGGWVRLCNTKIKDLPFKALNFENRYKHYLQIQLEQYPCYLPGIFERDNVSRGYTKPKLIYIGNKQDAENVFKRGVRMASLAYQEDIEMQPMLEKKNYHKVVDNFILQEAPLR